MDPLIGSALLGGGFNLLGGLFGSKERDRDRDYRDAMNERSYQFAREQWKTAREDQQRFIQTRVADARKAGIHPLYALGAPAGGAAGGGGVNLDVGPIGGSGLGEGLARAGQVAADAFSRRAPKALANAQLRQINSQASANEAQAAYYQSMAAKTAQDAVASGVGRGGVVLRRRLPTPGQAYDVGSGGSVRAFETYTRPDGSTGVKYTQDMQMDEAGQLLIGGQDASHYGKKRAKSALQRAWDWINDPGKAAPMPKREQAIRRAMREFNISRRAATRYVDSGRFSPRVR